MMSFIEGSDELESEMSDSYVSASSSSEECILPYHQKSPIIWCRDMRDNLWGHSIEADILTLRQARETGCETCTLVCEALATYKNIPMDQLSGRVIFSPGDFNVHWYFPLIGEEKKNSGRVTLRITVTPGELNL
ncbi:hypothetical protein F4806DRAFT_56004 [Annulohypoxylon nitens]|nr:hypothetical protein F4806DRAFT_56004 [Annulohypoxylon nitens]